MGSSLSARVWIETETFYFIFQTGKKEATRIWHRCTSHLGRIILIAVFDLGELL